IVANHGGRIDLLPGPGATFVVTLPVRPPRTTRTERPTARVLVVDDEVDLLDLCRRELTRRGYHVDTAASGSAALSLLETGSYRVVLLDLRMPGIDGGKVVQWMNDRRPELLASIVLMSGDPQL